MKLIDEKKYYKMSELVELSHLNNHTIQFYSKKGLLPQTLNTSKNMKYYPEITITVLNLIKYLKENLNFSIDYIKELFDYFKVDFSDRGDLILQSIHMLSYEIDEVKSAQELMGLPLEEAIKYDILEQKANYFKTEIQVLEVLNELKKYDDSFTLVQEYLQTAKKLALLEKELADKVIEEKGEVPEVLVLNILKHLKPFILNSKTIEAFKVQSN